MGTVTTRHDEITDEELLVVARVAARERWLDLAEPPAAHSMPRSLDESLAVERFAMVADERVRQERRPPFRRSRLLAALGIAASIGVCWYVSPTRTAIVLLGVGAFCLVALRRRRARRI